MRITTKVAPPDVSGVDARFDAAFIEPTFERSLERLGVNRGEWLPTHAPDEDTPIEAMLEALESIRESGRCAHIGGCKVTAGQAERFAVHTCPAKSDRKHDGARDDRGR